MRSEHFTDDGRPEPEDGQPTHDEQHASQQQSVEPHAPQHEHPEHIEDIAQQGHPEHEHDAAAAHAAHSCGQLVHHGHPHDRGHDEGHGHGRGFGRFHGEEHAHGHGFDGHHPQAPAAERGNGCGHANRGAAERGHDFGPRLAHGFGPDGHGHPTLARSILKSARRIHRSGLSPEQLQHRIAATVSHADCMTAMRTPRRIGVELRAQR